MRKGAVTALVLAIVVVLLAFGGTRLFLSWKKGGQAGLKINSTPQASVFINNEFKSKTPFDEKLSSGKYTIKLTPEGQGTQVASWQREVNLSAGLLTFINRELGASELTSAGEILSLEEIDGEKSAISVISTPDGATVALDGQEKGTTPLVISDVAPGEHTLFVFAPGFNSNEVKVKTAKGFKLNADVQLSLISGQGEATGSGKLEEGEVKKTSKVKVLDTPTGWLRVRGGPSLSDEEVAKVDPGNEYPLIGEEEGWFKIEYEDGKEGWISSRYAEKVGEEE